MGLTLPGVGLVAGGFRFIAERDIRPWIGPACW